MLECYIDLIGKTSVGHNSEATMVVSPICDNDGCYVRNITYNTGATIRQMSALIALSTDCQQRFTVSELFEIFAIYAFYCNVYNNNSIVMFLYMNTIYSTGVYLLFWSSPPKVLNKFLGGTIVSGISSISGLESL